MSEYFICEKCRKALPIGNSYVWVHVQVADKPAGDYRLHFKCFKESLKDNSTLLEQMTVVELMKNLEEGAEHGASPHN